MEKPAVTDLELHPLLKRRWSPRSFADQPIEKEILNRIFEAARWAPSSSNEQPWRFIVGMKGDTTWEKIMSTLVDFNQKWAALAPVLCISIGKKFSEKTCQPNQIYKYDVGQSLAYITFQALHENIFVHQMGGFSPSKASELFHVPNDYLPLTAFAMGYKGEPELLEEKFAKMEKSARKRIELKEIVFSEIFGNASSIVNP